VSQLNRFIANTGSGDIKMEALVPKIPEFVEGALANARMESFVEVSVGVAGAASAGGAIFVYLDVKQVQARQ
jgi:hypothetical protein